MQFANIIFRYSLIVIVTTFMCKVFLQLGGNLGNRLDNLAMAKSELLKVVGNFVSQSSVYETKAWGNENQNDYLNVLLIIETVLKPEKVLQECQLIERKLGRIRKEKWGDRTIDIDIIFFDDLILTSEKLIIPHPLISIRRFVLLPLLEIVPDFIHPVLKKTIKDLYLICEDKLSVRNLNFYIDNYSL